MNGCHEAVLVFLSIIFPAEFTDIAQAINEPIFIRLTFISGLILLVVGLVRRDLVVKDTDVPMWVVGTILLVSVPVLQFVFSPNMAFTTLVLDLGGRIFIGVISGLIVHVIVRAIKRKQR